MKRLSLVLCLIMVVTALFSCGAKAEENKLEISLEEIESRAENDLDFAGAEFYLDTDEYASDILIYQYGIEDEAVLADIDSYLITTAGTNSAKSVAVIYFKDGATEDDFSYVQKQITEVYLSALINRTALYDATQCAIAVGATFTTYDNALVMIAYGESDNAEALHFLFD